MTDTPTHGLSWRRVGWRSVIAAMVVAAALGTATFGPTGAAAAPPTTSEVEGIDFDLSTGNSTDWQAVAGSGRRFVYALATAGADLDPDDFLDGFIGSYATQTTGAREAGVFVGAYHLARPAASGEARNPATQANFFIDHGGAWSAGTLTLPGALLLGPDPNFNETCSFLAPSQMVSWIQEFVDTYRARTGRNPVIGATQAWWEECTGGSQAFGSLPLWTGVNTPGPVPVLPDGWRTHTFLRYDLGPVPGVDGSRPCETCEHEVGLDRFNGSEPDLLAFADNR